MNNKGFTLTELLASVAILAVISTIAVVSYSKVMKDNKIKQCEQKILFIEKQAIKYLSDNPEFLHNSNSIDININEAINILVDNNYLSNDEEDNDTINPITESEFTGSLELSKTNGLIDVKYVGDTCE